MFDVLHHNNASERVLLIACGAIAREVLAVIERNGLSHVELRCLPAELHMRPDDITDAVRETIRRMRGDFEHVYVVYGDCGTGGRLDAMLAEEGVTRIPGPHCYSFFVGNELFETRADEDLSTFYLTDFLARQFESFVVKPLGLDRWPDLVSSYFGNYEKLVYLAQTDDPELDRRAATAAATLGLAYERRYTGYGELEPALVRLRERTRV